jgi:5'-nucleotidase
VNILVVNDDGIFAEGILQLTAALSEAADIYVCAPHTQRSACGHGITIGHVVEYEFVDFPNAKRAISLEGTPADCVKIGLELYKDLGICVDRVFSGINHGANLGTDTLYSGTTNAAIEGAMCGLPSAAFSINAHEPVQYETAGELARMLADFDYGILGDGITLNVNIPNLPKDGIKGVKVTSLGTREYHEWYEQVLTNKGNPGYRYSGSPVFFEGLEPGANDIGADQAGYVSITPLQYDLTAHNLLDSLRTAIFTQREV